MWPTALTLLLAGLASAETGIDGWLRYAALPSSVVSSAAGRIPSSVVALGATTGGPLGTAVTELQKGLKGILGVQLTTATSGCNVTSGIVIATLENFTKSCQATPAGASGLVDDGFWLSVAGPSVHILAKNERGALYGAFRYLAMIGQGNFSNVAYASNPSAPIRWANQWVSIASRT